MAAIEGETMGLAGWFGKQLEGMFPSGRKPARPRHKLNKLKAELARWQGIAAETAKRLTDAQHERDQWRQQAERSEHTVEGLQEDLERVEKANRRLDEKNESLNEEVQAAARMIDTQQAWIERLQAVETARRAAAEGTIGVPQNAIGSFRVD